VKGVEWIVPPVAVVNLVDNESVAKSEKVPSAPQVSWGSVDVVSHNDPAAPAAAAESPPDVYLPNGAEHVPAVVVPELMVFRFGEGFAVAIRADSTGRYMETAEHREARNIYFEVGGIPQEVAEEYFILGDANGPAQKLPSEVLSHLWSQCSYTVVTGVVGPHTLTAIGFGSNEKIYRRSSLLALAITAAYKLNLSWEIMSPPLRTIMEAARRAPRYQLVPTDGGASLLQIADVPYLRPSAPPVVAPPRTDAGHKLVAAKQFLWDYIRKRGAFSPDELEAIKYLRRPRPNVDLAAAPWCHLQTVIDYDEWGGESCGSSWISFWMKEKGAVHSADATPADGLGKGIKRERNHVWLYGVAAPAALADAAAGGPAQPPERGPSLVKLSNQERFFGSDHMARTLDGQTMWINANRR
jgi:hypothetical protein